MAVVSNKSIFLGVILARGGSKAIPAKNLALAGGKPLIAYTIQAALNAACLHRVVVSTDSPEIAATSQSLGADVPFLRPAEIAQDDTPSIVSMTHAVHWLDENQNYRPDYVVLLQPTSPLRLAEDIEAAVEIAEERQADGVVSVCPAHQHPYWMKSVADDGRLTSFLKLDRDLTRRQDLPPAYALNGAVYVVRREILLERQTFYTEYTYAYIMPSNRSLDVETLEDLHLVDLILKGR